MCDTALLGADACVCVFVCVCLCLCVRLSLSLSLSLVVSLCPSLSLSASLAVCLVQEISDLGVADFFGEVRLMLSSQALTGTLTLETEI